MDGSVATMANPNPRKRKKFDCPLCGKPILYPDIQALWGRARRARHGGNEPEGVGPTPCCEKQLSMVQMKTLWAKATVAQREQFGAGTGRPKTPPEDCCPCGQMTKERAAKRNHVCVAPKPKRKRVRKTT